MKLIKSLVAVSIMALLVLSSCTLEEPAVKSSADVQLNDATTQLFARYVALGNSLTAGYQSAALTEKFQKQSYVKHIADQAGVGASFNQPLIAYPGLGSYTADGAGIMELQGFDASGNPVINPVPYAATSFNPAMPYASTDIMNLQAPYSNLGIPGIVLADLDSAITATNSYSHSGLIDPILRNPAFGNTNPIQQALMLQPTFVSVWIGNNDVLGYATSGGTSPAAPTDATVFQLLYTNMLNKVTSGGQGAKAVVANIPDVTSVPFFTTIGPKIAASLIAGSVPYPLAYQKSTDALTTGPATGQATTDDLLAGNVLITLVASPYASLIGQPTGAWYRYVAGKAGIPVSVLLSTMPAVDTTQAFGLDPRNPMPNALVLDPDEIAIAQQATADFNAAIAAVADQFGAPVVDANAFMKELAGGYKVAGVEFNASYITGGAFSLDGVHPNNIGYALLSNKFIDAINGKYGTNIPRVDIMKYMQDLQTASLSKVSQNVNINAFARVPELFGGKIIQ